MNGVDQPRYSEHRCCSQPTRSTNRRLEECRASLPHITAQFAAGRVSYGNLSEKIAVAGNPDICQVIVHVGPEALPPGRTAATRPRAARRFRGNGRTRIRHNVGYTPPAGPAGARPCRRFRGNVRRHACGYRGQPGLPVAPEYLLNRTETGNGDDYADRGSSQHPQHRPARRQPFRPGGTDGGS
jgi:hypothetical protein